MIDFIGDIQNYAKLNMEGEFEQKSYELDLHDDALIFKKQAFLNRIMYETQKNIYIPCQIIKKDNAQICGGGCKIYLEITKPRVIDYLIGLSDDLEQDLINYTNPLNKPEHQYRFTHHFQNSTTYPNQKPDNKFIFNTFGLVYKCTFLKNDYEKYSQGDNLYILFNISIYSKHEIEDEDEDKKSIFGFKLKPYLIEKQN